MRGLARCGTDRGGRIVVAATGRLRQTSPITVVVGGAGIVEARLHRYVSARSNVAVGGVRHGALGGGRRLA